MQNRCGFGKNKIMKYLLFDWNDVDLDITDLTEISNNDFENLAMEHGYVFNNLKEFEDAFNSQLFSTETYQLRIIPYYNRLKSNEKE